MVMNVARADIASVCFFNHASFSTKMTLGCFGKLICIALQSSWALAHGAALAVSANKVAAATASYESTNGTVRHGEFFAFSL